MNASQGVILIMVGSLALYLMWSANSPFNRGGLSTPGASGKSGLGPDGGSGQGAGGGGGGSWGGATAPSCLIIPQGDGRRLKLCKDGSGATVSADYV